MMFRGSSCQSIYWEMPLRLNPVTNRPSCRDGDDNDVLLVVDFYLELHFYHA